MTRARTFVDDLREEIIDPTLRALDMHSVVAADLLLGIAAHESGGFRHLRQSPAGPGVSLYQFEPWVAADVVVRYLDTRPDLRERLEDVAWPLVSSTVDWNDVDLPALRTKLIVDLRFATAVARLRLWMIPERLPRRPSRPTMTYVEALGRYWKRHWNTERGAGTVDAFARSWRAHVPAFK